MTSQPQVSVVMGSDSDWPVMAAAGIALDEFDVRWEADVVSAHRMPRDMVEYGSAAAGRGTMLLFSHDSVSFTGQDARPVRSGSRRLLEHFFQPPRHYHFLARL